jgi:hypothetical protein
MPTNYERAFADRPEVYAAWVALTRRSQRLRSSYCSLAHGSVLIERFQEPVRGIVFDRGRASRTALPAS